MPWQPIGPTTILRCIKHVITEWLREATVPFCTALVQPHYKYRVQFWAPRYKDIKLLRVCPEDSSRDGESSQRQDKKQLRSLALFCSEKTGGNLIAVYSFLKGAVEGQVLIPSLWLPAIRHKETTSGEVRFLPPSGAVSPRLLPETESIWPLVGSAFHFPETDSD